MKPVYEYSLEHLADGNWRIRPLGPGTDGSSRDCHCSELGDAWIAALTSLRFMSVGDCVPGFGRRIAEREYELELGWAAGVDDATAPGLGS